MAAADLRVELSCSVCREIYTEPVTLPCGHNFCLVCIERTWDWQREYLGADPSCPECRHIYGRRPELKKNVRLYNIVQQFLLQDRKCSIHRKMLEFYCTEDETCICSSCSLDGDHGGHLVELLSEASEKKKEKLRKVLEKLSPEKEETEEQIQRLQEQRGEVAEKAEVETVRITALFRDIREQLEALEKRLLSDISRKEEKVSHQLHELIQQLRIKKDKVTNKIHHIEELFNMADPLTVLQEPESDGDEFYGAEGGDSEGGREKYNIKVPAEGDLDMGRISERLITGLSEIVTGVEGQIFGQEATDLLLDINTAGRHVLVLEDRKTASYSPTAQCRPYRPERFQEPQTLSSKKFSSGQYYWDVEGSESGGWKIGVAYLSIERRGVQSWIGQNNKSWCLYRWHDYTYSVIHDGKWKDLPHIPSCRRIRISLDYEAGLLSFYELSEPIRHLHTFTATFTEPLHAAFWVSEWKMLGDDAWVRIVN